MSAWTFIAQRATTGEFLDWDVPLDLGGLEWQLSGPGSLKATVAPDVGGLRAPDGRLLLEEWGTLLYAEHDDVIRWGGILISCSFEGEAWSLEAAGFSTYPHSAVYEGELSEIGVDPAWIVQHLWGHLQSFPDSDLGVRVVGATETPVRLGIPAQLGVPTAKLRAAQDIRARLESGQEMLDDWTWPGAPDYVTRNNKALLEEWGGNPLDREASAAWLSLWSYNHADADIEDKEAEPYVLHWSEHQNLGDEIDSLTKETPFDWVERHYWSSDGEQIVHEVELGYPRLGRRRDDITFVQGDNVTSVVTVESQGDEFANSVLGLGAGEGRAMLRSSTGIRDGRLRRVSVYSDKSITDPARLDALIAEELNARKAAIRVTQIDVVDHGNAPIGSWQLGDDVLVRAEIPWLGEIEVWCRVTGWTLTGENTASLDVVRSDLYRYGGIE